MNIYPLGTITRLRPPYAAVALVAEGGGTQVFSYETCPSRGRLVTPGCAVGDLLDSVLYSTLHSHPHPAISRLLSLGLD